MHAWLDVLVAIRVHESLYFDKWPQIESGKLDLEHVTFDVWEIFESVVDLFWMKCSEKGVELLLDVAGAGS